MTDRLRLRFKWLTEPLGAFIVRLGIHPNIVTIAGLIGTVIGATLVAFGLISLGGLIILLMGTLDALDGAAARARGEKSPFGAFVDSVTDRYSEASIFLGLMIHYLRLQNNQSTVLILVFFAFLGSVMVSYTKARGETLGFNVNIGWLTRVERYLILAPLLLLNQPLIALWIIAILANFTAIQRIAYVHWQYSKKQTEDNQE